MPELSPTSRLMPNKHVRVREFDGELVLLDLKNGEYFALREVGVLAWHQISTGKTIEEVARAVAGSYEVTFGVALTDLLALGNEWIGRGLVEAV